MTSARTPMFDNARGLLIVLVVVGHSLEPLLPTEPLARGLYDGLYLFHIPAFAALSGHLSRPGFDLRLLKPLLVFQVLFVAFDVWVLGHALTWQSVDRPYWILWFLWSLLLWRLALVAIEPWLTSGPRRLAALLASVAIALFAGTITWIGYPFGLSRTLVFFPFFLGGHLFPREWIAPLRSRAGKVLAASIACGLSALVAAVAMRRIGALDTRWLYGTSSYQAIGRSQVEGIGVRGLLIAAGLVLTAAFFALSPGRRGVLTGYGARSLPPFLLHGFVVRGLIAAGAFKLLHGPEGVVTAVAGAVALALLLGTPPVAAITRPLWAPPGRFLQPPRLRGGAPK